MQMAVPQLCDLSDESANDGCYGLNHENEPTRIFGRECLLARRLVERGVRFIELTCPSVGHDRWDQHSNLRDGILEMHWPLINRLRPFWRTSRIEVSCRRLWLSGRGNSGELLCAGADGRDHNPFGFSIWMAGVESAWNGLWKTDEWGYKAVHNKVECTTFTPQCSI